MRAFSVLTCLGAVLFAANERGDSIMAFKAAPQKGTLPWLGAVAPLADLRSFLEQFTHYIRKPPLEHFVIEMLHIL